MKILFLLLIVVYCPFLLAQQVVATAGGSFGSTIGSMSFTIGEGVAQTISKGERTLTQGFHQTTVSVAAIYEIKELDFSISVFPNPTSDVVELKVGKDNLFGLQYLLYDLNGKLMSQKKLKSTISDIPFQHLSVGLYILKVTDSSKELKTFKIIKQ